MISKWDFIWFYIYSYSTGLVGILQTDENHSGKGYGSLVIRAISRKIAETGDNGYVGILEQNIQSRSIFEKMGYKRIGEIHYIISKMYWSEGDDWKENILFKREKKELVYTSFFDQTNKNAKMNL